MGTSNKWWLFLILGQVTDRIEERILRNHYYRELCTDWVPSLRGLLPYYRESLTSKSKSASIWPCRMGIPFSSFSTVMVLMAPSALIRRKISLLLRVRQMYSYRTPACNSTEPVSAPAALCLIWIPTASQCQQLHKATGTVAFFANMREIPVGKGVFFSMLAKCV